MRAGLARFAAAFQVSVGRSKDASCVAPSSSEKATQAHQRARDREPISATRPSGSTAIPLAWEKTAAVAAAIASANEPGLAPRSARKAIAAKATAKKFGTEQVGHR